MSQEAKLNRKRIFLTGATGSMGMAVARELLAAGHDVVGTTRSRQRTEALTSLGAKPLEVDLLDELALRKATAGFDVVAHFATSIPRGFDAARVSAWRTNDALRRHGTAALIAAAESNGIKRFIFESIALAYPDRGDVWMALLHECW